MIGIGQKVDTVEGEPIEHLIACHDRILARLATLERIGDALLSDPKAALAALRNTLKFFDTSGRLHTEDEEQSIFPRLRSTLGEEQAAYLESLESQHREKEQVYDDLKALAADLETEVNEERITRFRLLTDRLCGLYRPHIESENSVLVRLGRESLSQSDRDAIGREMRARRR